MNSEVFRGLLDSVLNSVSSFKQDKGTEGVVSEKVLWWETPFGLMPIVIKETNGKKSICCWRNMELPWSSTTRELTIPEDLKIKSPRQ